jgi:hypothetical protein
MSRIFFIIFSVLKRSRDSVDTRSVGLQYIIINRPILYHTNTSLIPLPIIPHPLFFSLFSLENPFEPKMYYPQPAPSLGSSTEELCFKLNCSWEIYYSFPGVGFGQGVSTIFTFSPLMIIFHTNAPVISDHPFYIQNQTHPRPGTIIKKFTFTNLPWYCILGGT